MTETAERQAVLTEARSWIGTPYHDCAMVKGAGVDCAMLVKAVYEATGLEPEVAVEPYSPQWYLHRSEEKYLDLVMSRCAEITEAEAKPGDVVLFKFGRCFAHGAIIEEPGFPQMIHAFKQAGIVTLGRGDVGTFADRPRRFFRRHAWSA